MFTFSSARKAASANKSAPPTGRTATPTVAARPAARSSRGFDFSRIPVQAKPVVNEPGDMYEQEADRVADAVTRGRALSGSQTITPLAPTLQAKCDECANNEEDEDEAPVQMKADPSGRSATSEDIGAQLRALDGGGSPLPDDQRADFESRLGHDFGDVRVHTDAAAASASQSIGARAFTHGRHIAFAPNQYAPGTTEGRHLLAHELTHVVQQSRGGPVGGTGAANDQPAAIQRDMFQLPTLEDVKQKSTAALKATKDFGHKAEQKGEQALHAVSDTAQSAVTAIANFREKICASPGECIGKIWLGLSFETKAGVIDWMIDGASQIIEKVPSRGLGFLWPLIRSGLLGFFSNLKSAKPEVKVAAMDKIATIIAGKSEAFNEALLKGFLKGFFLDGLLGPVIAVKDLVEALPTAWAFLKQVEEAIAGFPEDMQALVAEFRQFGGDLLHQVAPVVDELKALAADPARAAAVAENLATQAEGLANQAGGAIAQLFLNELSKQGAEAEVGDTAGRTLGNAIFETVVAILTAGGSSAVTAGKTALREVVTYLGKIGGKIAHGFMELFREGAAILSKGVAAVKKFALLMKDKAMKAVGGIGERLGGLIEKVEQFFKKLLGSCHESKLTCKFKTKAEQALESEKAREDYLAKGGKITKYRLGESGLAGIEFHHVFPQEFRDAFAKWAPNLNIDEYTVAIRESLHDLLHHPPEGSNLVKWNEEWRQFIKEHQSRKTAPTVAELKAKMEAMRKAHGIDDLPFKHYSERRKK